MTTYGRSRIEVPPSTHREGLIPALADPLAELERLRREAAAAGAAEAEARRAVKAAEAADVEAGAAYARGKRKSEPKPSAPAARLALSAAESQTRVLETAATHAEAELLGLIETHRGEAERQLVHEADKYRDEVREALATLRELEAERMRARGLCAWLHRPGRFNPAGFGQTLDVRQQNGDLYRLDILLGLIDAALAQIKEAELEDSDETASAETGERVAA
jgi:hypothetical protein